MKKNLVFRQIPAAIHNFVIISLFYPLLGEETNAIRNFAKSIKIFFRNL